MEQEITFSPKYFIGTEQEYAALNDAISQAKDYPDNDGTYRYTPEEPTLDHFGNAVMLITADVQENYSESIEGITLHDTYVQPFEVIEND